MPKHELMKSLEREGFSLNYPDNYSTEEKIIEILKEKEGRLYLAIPLLIKKGFDYEKIKKALKKLKDGQKFVRELNKIILITKEILKKTKGNYSKIEEIISKNKIKSSFTKKEFECYLEEFKESKRTLEKKSFEEEDLEKRKKIDSFKALEKIFSPGKVRVLRKIYDFKEITPTEKMYYYRDIKPLIDAILNKNLQEYLEIIKDNRGRK